MPWFRPPINHWVVSWLASVGISISKLRLTSNFDFPANSIFPVWWTAEWHSTMKWNAYTGHYKRSVNWAVQEHALRPLFSNHFILFDQPSSRFTASIMLTASVCHQQRRFHWSPCYFKLWYIDKIIKAMLLTNPITTICRDLYDLYAKVSSWIYHKYQL